MSTAVAHRPLLSRPAWVVGASLAVGASLILLLCSPWDRPAAGATKPLVLYCAAGMSKPVQELLRDYEEAYGVKVEVNFGGSGELLSSMRVHGGQGDLYLAADASYIREAQKLKLVKEVLAVAVLKPVLAVNLKTYERLQKEGRSITSAADLLLREDLRVYLANPELTSIGQVGQQLLQPSGLWRKLEKNPRVATVGTVQQVAQALQTQEGSVGVVWSAVAEQFGLQTYTPVEFRLAQEQVQIGVLSKSTQPAAALKLARYFTAADRMIQKPDVPPIGQQVFKKHHFDPIADADVWEDSPTLHLAAGAMLKPALDDIIAAFETREGIKIKTSYAGCGDLVAMMRTMKESGDTTNFPDIYFACDVSFLEQVKPWFEPGRNVSANDIVLLVAKGNPHRIEGLADLARPDLSVGLGHPTKSALGKLTQDLLQKKLSPELYKQVYDPETEMPAFPEPAGHLLVSKLRVGALDVAVVYRSNALSHPSNVANHLDIVELPGTAVLARQPFAIAKDSPRRQLARRLLQSLQAPGARDRFRELGFTWLLEAE